MACLFYRRAASVLKFYGYCLIPIWLAACVFAPAEPINVEGGGAPTLMAQERLQPTLTPTRNRLAATAFPTWTPTATYTPALNITHSATQTLTPTPKFMLCSPVISLTLDKVWHYISVPYLPPPMGEDARHQGIDITYYSLEGDGHSILSVGVQAVSRGFVAASIRDSYPFGNLVILETPYHALPSELTVRLKIPQGQSLYLLYAHLDTAPLVTTGQEVGVCQLIGFVGRTGNTNAPHLHLETRYGPPGVSFSGFSAFTEDVTPEEAANYRRWRIGGEFRHFDPMLLLDPLHPSPTVTPSSNKKP